MDQLEMFVLNMRLLVGLLAFLGLVVFLLLLAWTGLKMWTFHVRRRRAGMETRARKYRPNGRPYPPSAAGICEKCGGTFADVFHLPNGARRCRPCYEREEA